ncbi:aspartate-alanine antiporter [Usitatibacter palustris]|uniref:Aspartate/alanine antiporter n=1 Tax=Usitatibacter palustris TaxID=2732487 RepID=A0A6M4H6I2_9PROT|nr:aspartate-alanine antiporter [Usitatibacter palustris]QJR15130.1 Aspartate/alanine antiporter [Usitatibacter palustris]
MEWIAPYFEKNAELAVFLAIGVGYWIGKFKIKGVGFGPVTGSLLAGLMIGSVVHVPVSDTAKSLLFLLFMYGIGYSAGPGFLRGIRDGGWRWVALGIVIPVTGLLTAYAMAKVLNLEMGYAAGMMSGGLTESPVIGTASEAIRALPISDEEKTRLVSQIPIADALTYIFGTFGVIFFCSYIGPWLLRLDLKAEALKVEQDLGFERETEGVSSGFRMFELRAYEIVPPSPAIGTTVEEAEKRLSSVRVFVERVRRNGKIIEVRPDLVLQAHDVVAVIGRQEALLKVVETHVKEIFDRDILDVPTATFDVVVTSKTLNGRTVAQIREESEDIRGVFLKSIKRGEEQIPIAPGTRIFRGDLVTLHGLEPAVRRVSERIGDVLQGGEGTDFIALGLAICFGALAGLVLTFPVGGLHIAMGTSVAVLIVGLGMGWRNSVRPTFAVLPHDAIELMKSLGLAAFVAMIGLKAGPVFLTALKEIGLTVFLGGIVVTLTPQLVGLVVGRYVLKLNPLLLLGALAGAQTMTAGLAAVQERSGSPVAVIGYSSTVAFGHILISIGGTALIWMLHSS